MTGVIGWDKLQAQLKRIEKAAVEGKAPTLEGAKIVYARSQELVPVDTGELKASGYVKEAEEGAVVGYSSDHAIFQEFGTSTQAGTPFLRPAIDEVQKQIVEKAGKAVEEEVREAL